VRLPRLLAGGMLAAVLTGTSACGLQAAEPKLELRDAMADFAAGRAGTLQLSLPSSADDVRAFAGAADPSGGDGGMTDDDLEQLLSSSVELGYDFGEDRDSDADDTSRFVVHLEDLDAAEVRTVDGVLYARADVDGLAEKFPEMQADLDTFRGGLTGADVPAETADAATALLDGEWVSVDIQAYLDSVQALVEQVGEAGGVAPDDPTAALSDMSSAEVRDLLGDALKGAVTSVERREGDDDLGDHLVTHLDLRKAYATLRSGLPELEEQLPPVDEVPDKQIDVSFWVLDGDLTRIELDLAQFLDEPAGHLVLRADVLAPEEITAPSDAVEFDVAALMETAMSASDPDVAYQSPPKWKPDAYEIATWVDEDFANVAYEWHTAPSVHQLPEVLPLYEGLMEGLEIIAVGDRIQVTLRHETVCLTLSYYGNSEDIADGPC
jgi:hypothetical protein